MAEAATPDKVPRRLGRYDVVAVVARRSSTLRSTVLIATAARNSSNAPTEGLGSGLALSYSPLSPNEGTTTSQKPVALKHIAPALMGDEALVESFLESARLVTAIRHANVAHVHEVGRVGSDVFLTMDYVMGETAAALMRRLHSRGETLDCILAAYIIAEACAGLEAAHDAGVLHERLTPHDLFIGYDGSVRVLDIGIAAARSRMAGERDAERLELEYTSPERCRKQPFDRRSDVFSLGAMLWELDTGFSPFERAKEVAIIRAICDEAILPPGQAVPGLPEEMSAITMTALARDPNQRYPSALALRQALLGLIRNLGAEKLAADELSKLMNLLFETRVRDKREMLRRIATGASLAGLDVGETDAPEPPRHISQAPAPPRVDPDEPSIIIKPDSNPELVPSRRPAVALPELPAPRKPARSFGALVWAITALLVVGGALLAALALRRGAGDRTLPSSSATVPSGPTAALTPVPVSIPVPYPDPTASAPPAAAEETVVHIETVPTHAMILIGGAKKGISPIDLKVPRSADAVIVEIRHAGYQTLKEKLVPDQNQRLKLTLVAAREPGSAPASSAPFHKFE